MPDKVVYTLILFFRLMRLHQPTGIWLLLWPCWWSIAMASDKPWPNVYLLALFVLGAIVMRGAGCVINDIVDRDIDRQVERTKHRPLASGQLSVFQAYELLFVLLVLGLVILLQMNSAAIMLSLGFFVFVMAYPFMKRLIAWPQLFLGITFNAGALIGWAAVSGGLQHPALALYAAGFFWTLGYDTIYAHQDKKDDAELGVHSSALSLGDRTKVAVAIFYLAMILLLVIAGRLVFVDHNMVYYFSLLLAIGHLTWQVKTVKLDDPADCMRKFKSNAWFGWIIFFGILIEKMLPYS